ncbi:hypothetical protein IC229_08670 [Spirosoma sp. BT702]|uniref:AlgX/AlgJ SGNH hydrolase-like domain-containing protein n=1 Tax=Spirosoma profusum TaxID=2771354 RepID=A0A927ATN9_9BACT|nr:hypothetical protein [Spirosoma profusum]MBD2700707.1 hypothetical protein [Spirosoma profusum]
MRIFRWSILLITIVFWASGLSTGIAYRLSALGVITDQVRFGDLYQFSALPQFKQPWPEYAHPNRFSDTAATHLYIIGDSFTLPLFLNKSDFRVSHYERWGMGPLNFVLSDSTKRNVLLIESVERNIRQNFAMPHHQDISSITTYQEPNWLGQLSERFGKGFHRNRVETRLEAALFNHDWAFWFKEIKAQLTLNWFGRTDAQVSLSKDKKHLFYFMEADNRLPQNSSFSPLEDAEVDSLIQNLNKTADYYRHQGFDEIYLSLIPNKASILDTNRTDYNHLIERIQNSPNLAIPIVNTYNVFKQSSRSLYLKGDTHWNCEGHATWLKLVQQKLRI